MSKNDKKKKEPVGLRELLSGGERRRLQDEVLEKKDAYLESERVLIAENQRVVQQIIDYVKECERVFVTREKSAFAPSLPSRYSARMDFQVPTEITPPRERAYFQDREFFLRSLGAEVRQEVRLDAYKQTTKIGGAATSADSTLDRMEQASKITGFGFNVYAIGDKRVRELMLTRSPTLVKPVLRMISQRERICYHPEGNPEILIEMALEKIHIGQTFNGFVWSKPKIDLEIKMGPEKTGLRHTLLAAEERRLCKIFSGGGLTKQLNSSPTPGFEVLENFFSTDKGRAAFDKLETRAKWWEDRPMSETPRLKA